MAPRATISLLSLRYWRTQRLLMQRELAEKAGLHWTTVQRLEAGQRAEIGTVRQLAQALDVDPSDLIREPPET
jgi:transcriptional regulator with XRE-family HTH domain